MASLDHLSGGRAAWNVVTGRCYRARRRAVRTARELWESWPARAVVGDRDGGRYVAGPDPGAFAHHGDQFDLAGHFTVPRSPQVHPVILQAGDSPDGREFAVSSADAIFSGTAPSKRARTSTGT
ncbi:hypothetical protein GCM10027614_83080 [Micromonospora vulcania]